MNQPPRPRQGVATPPSKGGENNINILKFNTKTRTTFLILFVSSFRLLKLTAKPIGMFLFYYKDQAFV